MEALFLNLCCVFENADGLWTWASSRFFSESGARAKSTLFRSSFFSEFLHDSTLFSFLLCRLSLEFFSLRRGSSFAVGGHWRVRAFGLPLVLGLELS